MRSIEELRGLVAGVTRVVVQERHHLRHLLLLQLAGPAPRAEARPALVHGAGRRLLRVPGVQCLHRNTVYCTVLYCTGVPVPIPQHRHCLPRRRAARLRRPHYLDCPGQLQQSFLLSQSQS